ncbi:MAG: PAS domain S-box protein [Deltaproteobacteria bacterium]|nr:PAS domain S-box protein [Deltaproteobacteria bacterium]
MSTPLRILMLEDRLADVELILYELRRAGFAPDWQRVETAPDYLAQLQGGFAVILADYSMPQFDARRALRLLQERGLDIPFIIVSGSISEEVAVECMKEGAADYLLKDRLARLGPAVTRALQEKALRDEKRRAEKALRESEERYRMLAENMYDLVCELSQDARYLYLSPNYPDVLGYAPGELLGRNAFESVHPNDLSVVLAEFGKSSGQVAYRVRHKNGEWRWFESTGKVYHTAQGEFRGVVVSRDITARKRAEEALQVEAQISSALVRVGQEMLVLLETPTILNHLCQLTTEVLGCDSSHTFLWQPEEDVFVPVSGYGDTPEQWESLRVIKIPCAMVARLLARLERDEVMQVKMAEREDQVPVRLAMQYGVTVGLSMALRRGGEVIGIQTAGYRGRQEPFTPQQERIARGIAQIASMALENARLLERLERANRLKSDFVATMSHELRTPLNVIMGYTEILLEEDSGSLTAEQADFLGLVDRSARELLALITATLDVRRLEARQMSVEVREVHLPDLLREIEAETQQLRTKPGLRCEWRVATDLLSLHTDPLKLKVVLKNLVNNAVKFTEEGSVTIDAHARDGGVEICVADTGIGITPEVLPHIFEMFRQGDSSTTRRYKGVGLGLYIVRRLLELLRGTVAVESEIGRGSTFRVWVPLDSPSR